MIFEYVSVGTGAVLDTITVDALGDLAYDTGRARGTVDMLRRRLGQADLIEVGDWSNGYVQLRRRDGGDQGGQDAGQQS